MSEPPRRSLVTLFDRRALRRQLALLEQDGECRLGTRRRPLQLRRAPATFDAQVGTVTSNP
jgi:hypothetical protein